MVADFQITRRAPAATPTRATHHAPAPQAKRLPPSASSGARPAATHAEAVFPLDEPVQINDF